MILLQQDKVNQVTVTLTEKQLTTGSLFLLNLTNDTTKRTYPIIVQDVSPDPLSYNTFYIPVTSSANTLSGSVNLDLPGFYSYTFFEGTSSVNPTSSIGLNVVETGKAQLLPSSISATVSFTGSDTAASAFNPSSYGL